MSEKIKVLLGDNSYNFGILCSEILTKYGFDVYSTPKNGVDVLSEIVAQKPQIIIIDSTMPHIDAVGIIKCVKFYESDYDPYFVVVSSYENSYFQRQTLEAGAAEYILKPFDISFFCEKIVIFGQKVRLQSQTQTCVIPHNLDNIVSDVILSTGMPMSLKGYCYLKNGVLLYLDDEEIIHQITKVLYPKVAKKYNSSADRVERSMRHAIKTMWDKGNIDVIKMYFKKDVKPTNSEFITIIANQVKLHMR